MATIFIGLAGLGNVGAGVYKNLLRNAEVLAERTGHRLEVRKVAVRDLTKRRDIDVPSEKITKSWRDLLADPEIQIIVELMGGVDEAHELVTASILAGKAVVTGNKALLAEHGHELIAMAEKHDVPLYFEAAVAGGIPIIKAVREALVGNHIQAIYGIVNGTSNFILTQMRERGLAYRIALAEAQRLGYAEADPTLDVNGWDAAHKAIVLAWLSYGLWVRPAEIFVDGIEHVSLADMRLAERMGYVIKLLAVVRLHDDQRIEVRVQPTLIPAKHILSSVSGVFNAVVVHGDIVGETLFYGSGAGQNATSSAVIADLVDAANNLSRQAGCQGFLPSGFYGQAIPLEETISAYYVRLRVEDKPGVIAQVATALAAHGIGLSSIVQPEVEAGGLADLMLMMHAAPFLQMRAALADLEQLSCVVERPILMRVENFSAP
ncbi:MAG: homoserine dehydrogenase [Verrucomicrobiales bacterium]